MTRGFWKKKFSPTERRVLDRLTGPNTGKVVSHRQLIAAMSGLKIGPIFPTNRQMELLRQMIGRLRKKIEKDPALPDVIITHRGEGYSFQVEGLDKREGDMV